MYTNIESVVTYKCGKTVATVPQVYYLPVGYQRVGEPNKLLSKCFRNKSRVREERIEKGKADIAAENERETKQISAAADSRFY